MKYLHTMRLWLVCLLLRGTRARDVLKVMDRWSEGSTFLEIRDLWDILSALRGPDDYNSDLKQETTCRIRARTVPNLAYYSDVNRDGREIVGWYGDHFGQHVMAAVAAINRQGL